MRKYASMERRRFYQVNENTRISDLARKEPHDWWGILLFILCIPLPVIIILIVLLTSVSQSPQENSSASEASGENYVPMATSGGDYEPMLYIINGTPMYL